MKTIGKSLFFALICLNTGAWANSAVHALATNAAALTVGQTGPSIEARHSNACEDAANLAVECCIFVEGWTESRHCQARYGGHARHTEHAVGLGIEVMTKLIAHGKTVLGSLTTGYLIGHFATHRLDLTGMERLAAGQIARCLNGEGVGPRRSEQYNRMTMAFSNPLSYGGRNTQAKVQAFVEKARQDCREYTAKQAIDRMRRPVTSTRDRQAQCGVLISEPSYEALRSEPYRSVRNTRYCAAPRQQCCWENRGWFPGSTAYCYASNAAVGGIQRICANAAAPASP